MANKGCPVCGKHDAKMITHGNPKDGPGRAFFSWRCPCGLISKLFDTIWEARKWWNTRGGKVSKEFQVEVTVSPEVQKISGVEVINGETSKNVQDLGHMTPHSDLKTLQDEVELHKKPF